MHIHAHTSFLPLPRLEVSRETHEPSRQAGPVTVWRLALVVRLTPPLGHVRASLAVLTVPGHDPDAGEFRAVAADAAARLNLPVFWASGTPFLATGGKASQEADESQVPS